MTDAKSKEKATELFNELGVKVVTSQRFLGGYVGDRESTEEYVQQQVQNWVHRVEKLTNTATSQPQAAYAALTKSLQVEWTYLQRVIPNCATAFAPLMHILFESFMPTVMGGSISEQEKALLSIPVQMGGMGI